MRPEQGHRQVLDSDHFQAFAEWYSNFVIKPDISGYYSDIDQEG